MGTIRNWFYLGLLDLAILYLAPKIGSVFFIILFLKILSDLNVFRRVNIGKTYFPGYEIYYREFVGNYKNIANSFINLRKDLGLTCDAHTLGIYYDNPKECDPNKCRAIVALINDKNYNFSDEQLNSLGLKKTKLPSVECLSEYFSLVSLAFVMIPIKKFYSAFVKFMNDKESVKRYHFEPRANFFSVEVYRKDRVTFYVPTKHNDEFLIHTGGSTTDKKND
jgi:DNA gyrase inhibitor GyrI